MTTRLIETWLPIAALAEAPCRSGFSPTATVSGRCEAAVGLKPDLQPDLHCACRDQARKRAARIYREKMRAGLRERTPMTPFPAPNRLHVWWARRPLVASRAAILAALLPADADRERFMHVLGIHEDPVAAKVRIAKADRACERLRADAYGYPRAFTHLPSREDLEWLRYESGRVGIHAPTVLDPTAGGGSIPYEANCGPPETGLSGAGGGCRDRGVGRA